MLTMSTLDSICALWRTLWYNNVILQNTYYNIEKSAKHEKDNPVEDMHYMAVYMQLVFGLRIEATDRPN